MATKSRKQIVAAILAKYGYKDVPQDWYSNPFMKRAAVSFTLGKIYINQQIDSDVGGNADTWAAELEKKVRSALTTVSTARR